MQLDTFNYISLPTYEMAVALLGHPVPTGSPMGLLTFFFLFFFVFRHTFSMFGGHFCEVNNVTDWAEILQNDTYGHAPGRGKKWFG